MAMQSNATALPFRIARRVAHGVPIIPEIYRCSAASPPATAYTEGSQRMIRANARWREFEAHYQREAYRDLSFHEALAAFEAMWRHARKLNPCLGEDWREDLKATIAVARALNGLPPS